MRVKNENTEKMQTYEVEWSKVEYKRHDAWCAENPDVPPMPDPISLLMPMTQEKENTSHTADESTTNDDSKKEMIVVWVGGWRWWDKKNKMSLLCRIPAWV